MEKPLPQLWFWHPRFGLIGVLWGDMRLVPKQ